MAAGALDATFDEEEPEEEPPVEGVEPEAPPE